MSEAAVLALVQGLVGGLPALVALVRSGKPLSEIRVGDFISADALEKIRAANERAAQFVADGEL